MKIENVFEVKASIDTVWSYLLDVEQVAPCMPGAELTEVVDDRTWKGKTNVKIGPVSLSFAGTVTQQERDDAGHRMVLKADGREQRGKGAASALVVSRLEGIDGGTRVSIDADLTITGAVAQYGRGMIQDISQRLTDEFARCLEAGILASTGAGTPAAAGSEPVVSPEPAAATGETIAADPESTREGSQPDAYGGGEPMPATRSHGAGVSSTAEPAPVVARPMKGLRLGLWAFWRAVVRFVRRLFGRPA